jgi:hypothetical protein
MRHFQIYLFNKISQLYVDKICDRTYIKFPNKLPRTTSIKINQLCYLSAYFFVPLTCVFAVFITEESKQK